MRLIDADALLDKVKDYGDGQERLMLIDPYWVRKAPTVDRPHGEWEKYGDKKEAYDIEGNKSWGQMRRCTNCGFIKTYIEDFGFYSICPNCGALMNRGGKS